jgi:hypothetical protein
MISASTRLHALNGPSGRASSFRTAVSLHSHTLHSGEDLRRLPWPICDLSLVQWYVRRRALRNRSYDPGWSKSDRYLWRPPVLPRRLFEQEIFQISERLGLHGFVSITDHDSIDAPNGLRILGICDDIPVSLEWTVPFEESVLHIGIHNLTGDSITGQLATLREFTARPWAGKLRATLEELAADEKTLLVLNHPFADVSTTGVVRHARALVDFLGGLSRPVHALEVNGLRPWRENEAVIELAEELGYPAVSGGNRHGRQPNTLLNLTTATCFSDFVAEIREERRSDILILPEYRISHKLRLLEIADEAFGYYPQLPRGFQGWPERVYLESPHSGARPLSQLWQAGEPPLVRLAVLAVRLLVNERLRPSVRCAMLDNAVP